MPAPLDIDDIVFALKGQIRGVVAELFPGGRAQGHEFFVGSLAGEAGRSLAVHLDGPKAGVWKDFATGEAGDALDLVAQALFAGDKGKALTWAKRFTGLEAGDPAALAKQRRRAKASARRAVEDEGRRRADAMRIWLAAEPDIIGTPVQTYLAGRGIRLPILGKVPGALRYHPGLWNGESGRKWPAMVALIHNRAGACSVHRTWLAIDDKGVVDKAPLEEPRMTLGAYKGGSIRLWRGASGAPLAQAPAGDTAILGEGNEDGLTLAQACPEFRVLATVSVGNMADVDLPDAIGTVILAKDKIDHPDPKVRLRQKKEFERAIRVHRGAGRVVRVAASPVGKDFNDVLTDVGSQKTEDRGQREGGG